MTKHELRCGKLTMIAAFAMAGCSTTAIVTPTATPAAPVAFKEAGGRWAAGNPADATPRGAWWEVFGDAELAALIERATADNTSVQSAAARLKQAQALLRSTRAGEYPELGISAGASRAIPTPGTGFPPGVALTDVSAGASASWQPDLFAKISKAVDAAHLEELSSEAMLQSTRLLVQTEVARTYFTLRSLDAERALFKDTVDAYRDTLQLTQRLYAAGEVAELDFSRVRAEVSSTEAEALALDRQRAAAEHALAVLVGELPSDFGVPQAAWDAVAPVIPAGVPSAILSRRPDVAAAERAMEAAEARLGVARTAWFPHIDLTASAGYASTDLSDLFKWTARAWGIGALVSLPLFDGGRREAAVQAANAQWDAAAAAYRQTVLEAFKDVEDQLSALRLLDDQSAAEADAVDASTKATMLSVSRYRNGYISQLEVLDATRSELSNRRHALDVRTAQYQATVSLIQALGGGWEAPQRTSSIESTRSG